MTQLPNNNKMPSTSTPNKETLLAFNLLLKEPTRNSLTSTATSPQSTIKSIMSRTKDSTLLNNSATSSANKTDSTNKLTTNKRPSTPSANNSPTLTQSAVPPMPPSTPSTPTFLPFKRLLMESTPNLLLSTTTSKIIRIKSKSS